MFLCYYANKESNDILNSSTKIIILNQEYLQKDLSSVLLGTRNRHRKKQNYTYHVVTMATLGPSLFGGKPNIPICNLLKGDGVLLGTQKVHILS